MTRTLALAGLLLAVAHAAPACEPPPLTAAGLLSRIESEGGRAVLWDLWERPDEFDQVLDGIASGDGAWLEVAVALKPFSDAGASLSLNYAVGMALPKAPDRVLALTVRGFAVDRICTSPFIEPAPGVAEAYEREALAALARVESATLEEIAERCADGVRLPPVPRPPDAQGG